jgi:aryl-phospho-beta-D-glucosidase BglC (GH1 family)
MRTSSLLLPALAAIATAWMPEEHMTILSRSGTNLFSSLPISGRNGAKRWLPGTPKIRGVNVGSHLVFEPWLAGASWSAMGCGPYKSEFDCVAALGQDAANAAFANHWNTWITRADIQEMLSYGLNTIRIPVGYWIREDIVYADSEHFPKGGLQYLERLCGWASDAGFYIIIDLHGAPGAQVAQNPFTGQVSCCGPNEYGKIH